jgi:hypothetical protein
VDWCDAHAYCAAVEKRLCRKSDGGATETLYSFGKSFDETGSNDHQAARYVDAKPSYVGALRNCTSSVFGYTGVYELSGNVWAREDSRNGTGANSQCLQRGGSYY